MTTKTNKSQAEELKQFYVAYARKVIPDIPENCPDKKCLSLLQKHTKRKIRFLSLFPATLSKEMNGVKQACQYYIAYANSSTSKSERVKTSFARWLEILLWVIKNHEFIKNNLDFHLQLSDELKQLKNNNQLF